MVVCMFRTLGWFVSSVPLVGWLGIRWLVIESKLVLLKLISLVLESFTNGWELAFGYFDMVICTLILQFLQA